MHESSLSVFISSTADLSMERLAVEKALKDLSIESSRFESWPASPNAPMSECLRHLEESDTVVLILGAKYGTVLAEDISATHMEYKHAKKLSKKVFAFILEAGPIEERQKAFIAEVQQERFRKKVTGAALANEVKRAILHEFFRSFRQESNEADNSRSQVVEIPTDAKDEKEPAPDLRKALDHLRQLYEASDDQQVKSFAGKYSQQFPADPEIMNFIYMTEVNQALDHCPQADFSQIEKAVLFWRSPVAEKKWMKFVLHYNIGNALLGLKRFAASSDEYRKSLELQTNYAPALKNLGSALSSMGQEEAALDFYRSALDHDPMLMQALHSMGVLYFKKGDFPAAIKCFNKISLSQLNRAQAAGLHAWKAMAFVEMGEVENAVASGEDAISVDPQAQWTWFKAANAYLIAQESSQAWHERCVAFWRRYTTRFEYDGKGWAQLGFLLWKKAEDSKSVAAETLEAFKNAVANGHDTDGLVWDKLGHLYQQLEKRVDSFEAFKKASAINAAKFGYCLGVCLMGLDRHEEAIPLLEEAANRHQPDGMSWSNLAKCHERTGDSKKAIAAYKKAIAIEPGYEKAWFNLGGIYWNNGDFQRAIRQWEKALNKFPESELQHQVRDALNSIAAPSR